MASIATNTTNLNNIINTANSQNPASSHFAVVGGISRSTGIANVLEVDSNGNIRIDNVNGGVTLYGQDRAGLSQIIRRSNDANCLCVTDFPNDKTFVSEFLKNGAVINAAVDYSVTTGTFSYTNSSTTEYVYIERLIMMISDGGKLEVFNRFASSNELTNGLQIIYESDGTTYDLTTDRTIKSWQDIMTYFDDFKQSPDLKTVTYIWNLPTPIILSRSGSLDQIRVVIDDDLSNQDLILFRIQGYKSDSIV